MRVLLILALAAAAVLLLSLVRLGVWAAYQDGRLTLRIRIGPVRITLLPKKKKRTPKAPKPHKKEMSKPPRTAGDLLDIARRALPVALEAAGRLKRKIRVDRIYLDVIVAGEDPAAAALAYGGVNAAVGMIWPLVEQNLNVKDRRIRTRADFSAAETQLALEAAAALTVGQALSLALWLLPRLPGILGQEGKRREKQTNSAQKEAV